MDYEFDPFAPLGLRVKVAQIGNNTLVQAGVRRDLFYTKAEVDAKLVSVTGGATEQSYQTFIYNSTGGQSGNRFNTWSDLMTATVAQEGGCVIVFEQDETIPAGTWNWNNVVPKGDNGLEYNAGGWTLTFGDNTYLSGWTGCTFEGIRILSTSTTGHICSFSSPTVISSKNVANVHSTYIPFFEFTGSGQCIIAPTNSGRWQKLAGGVENLAVTSGAFAAQIILAYGEGATVTNDTISSTSAQVFIIVVGTVVGDFTVSFPPTNTNLIVGFGLTLLRTDALALKNTPAGGIAATNVQAAINELDSEKADKTGTADVEITASAKGIILKDRFDGTRYRLYINAGVLLMEAA